MKKSNILLTGSAALVALIAVTGIALSTMAADDATEDTSYFRHFWGKNLTEEEKAERQTQMEERRAEMQAKREAIDVVLEAGDYQDWVEAVGEDCPMLEKINEDNFPRLVEAHGYMRQARGIFEELGIEKSGFGYKGFRGHMKPF